MLILYFHIFAIFFFTFKTGYLATRGNILLGNLEIDSMGKEDNISWL